MKYSVENPWIAERETSLCIWKVDYNRGFINNMATSLFVDFMSYSNRQIAEYVKMIKSCGFTGIQVTDICSAWRYSGSWEPVHDKFRVLADCLHKNGMKFTLWCWAAEFSGHGWRDDSVAYVSEDPATSAYDDPKVFAAFDKYYDIYAELAPYVDRVIAHFFDPGNIYDIPSVLKFATLLFNKFRAVNPDVKIGIDTWGCPEDFPGKLIEAGFPDVMLMELPFLPNWRAEGKRARFREGVKALGCELGSWGWYTSDYEIDQQPIMSINDRVLKDVFNQTRIQGDHVMTPSYWSEIDSYHVINFFSLYASGHLMIDPERDTDEITAECVELVAGKKNAADLKTVVDFIRDARSGDTWSSYWWTEPDYILEHGDHADIAARADGAIAALERLISDKDEHGDVHMPITVNQLYRLMMPHLWQIRQYAQFCLELDELKKEKEQGVSLGELQAKVDKLPFEIPEYNCVIGLWGQVEARFAYGKVRAFCEENDLVTPKRRTAAYVMKRRLYDHMTVHQRGLDHQNFCDPMFYEGGLAFGAEQTKELVSELVDEGVFVRRESDGFVALSNWESFRFDFNI